MGGAIAVRLAHHQQELAKAYPGLTSSPPDESAGFEHRPPPRAPLPVIGLAVIDVVEGSALDALNAMHSVIKSRPSKYEYKYCIRIYGFIVLRYTYSYSYEYMNL